MNTLGRTWVLPNWCLSWLTCWRRTFKAEPQDCRPCWRLGRFLETSWERWNFVCGLEWRMVLLLQPPDWNMSLLVGAPKSSVLVATLRQQAVGFFFIIHACRSSHCLCLKSPLDRKTPYTSIHVETHLSAYMHTHAWIMRMGFLDGGQASFCGAVHQLARCGQAPGCATGEEAAIGSLKGTKSWEDKKISDGTKQAKQFRSSTKRPLSDDRYFLICWILRGSFVSGFSLDP